MRLRFVALAAALTGASLAGGWVSRVEAQGLENHLYPPTELDVGGTLLRLSETIRIDPQNRPELGTEINVEDVLGVSRTTLQPRLAFRWRPGCLPIRRHELEVGFFRAVRSAEKTLDRTIVFRDTTFNLGAQVNSNIRTSQLFVNYRFAFTAHENTQIGFTVGLGAIFLRSELDALTAVNNPQVQYADTSKFTAPVGSVGFYGRFRLGNRWYLEPDLRAIYVKISNFKAGVLEGGAAVRYFFSNTIGAELGYGLGFYKVIVETPESGSGFLGIDVHGKVKYTVNGLRGGVVFLF
jgi:hypothetical protein